MSIVKTAQAEAAHDAATRDREAQACLSLDVAVCEALKLIRAGEPGKAEFVLGKAGMSADRILGGAQVGFGTVWTGPGRTVKHVCDRHCEPDVWGCCWNGHRKAHTMRDGACLWCLYPAGAVAQ